jgi:hypothetical protein
VSERDAERLDREFDRISRELPETAGQFLRWLRGSSSRWVRVPVGLLLIAGGVVGFLPVLGFWMIPLGALLLAQDAPFLQRPTLRLLTWLARKWTRWKRRSRR